MTFGERLLNARKEKGLTQKELALRINAAHNSISNWENNQNKPDPDTIELLCDALDVTPNYFFNREQKSIFDYSNIMPLPKMKRVPMLGTIACGEPLLAETNLDGFVNLPENIDADFSLRCEGDSMINARIFDGDIVFIRQQSDVEEGEIAAVRIGNEATLKKVYRRASSVILRACNPTFDDLVYTDSELDEIEIIGKAVYFLSTVR